jgi:hypothetical protein
LNLLSLNLVDLSHNLFRRVRSSRHLANRYCVRLLSSRLAYFRDIWATIDYNLLRSLTGDVPVLASGPPDYGRSIDDRRIIDDDA